MYGTSFESYFLQYLPALRNDNFRYFWLGQCISLIGTWAQRTAQQWLVYTLTDSAFLLGLLGVFQFGPMLCFSLLAGVYVDRFPKKRILLITQTVLMLQAFILAALVFSGTVKYWHILVLATVMGLANTIDMPARQSFFIEMVGRDILPNAIALNSTIFNLARIIGPAVSGILIGSLGIAMSFLLNAISFIAVLYGLNLINIPNPVIRVAKNANVLLDIKDGLSYIFQSATLFKAVALMLSTSILAMNTEVILPIFVHDILNGNATTYSALLSAIGIGSTIGAVLAAFRNTPPSHRRLYLSTLSLASIMIIAGLVQDYRFLLLCMFCFGFCNITFITSINSLLQLNSADEYRGRVMSVYALTMAGATPIGNLLTGTIIQHSNANMGFLICGTILFGLIIIIAKYVRV